MPRSSSSRFIPDYGDVRDPDVRAKYGYLEAGVSIAGNAALFALKLVLGLMINSIALIADAFHTLSDVGTSGVVIFGFRMGKKPPDERHPHGHGRMEYICTVVIAVLLVVTGLLFIEQSVQRWLDPPGVAGQSIGLLIGLVILVTAVAKEMMARFSFTLGRRIDSDALRGDAWHHRSDAFASVAVGLGVIGSTHGYPLLDPLFGLLVSLIIIYVGVDLFRNSSDYLMGQAVDEKTVKEIEEIASSQKQVRGVHDIQVHDYGTCRIVSLHAEMGKDLKMEEAHRIADRLEDRIRKRTGCTTIIHMEPREPAGEELERKQLITEILAEMDEIISFHKIQLIRSGSKDDIRMHLIVDSGMSVETSHRLAYKLKKTLQKRYGPSNVDIHFDPCCGDCKACTIWCTKKQDGSPRGRP